MFEHRPVSKESQLYNNRKGKYTQKQLGQISDKVRKQVRARSKGICEVKERCNGAPALEQAHKQSRNTIDHKTTADDLLDACVECHRWLDGNGDGVRHKRLLREKDAG